jgi:hypothetical protein
LLAAVGCGGGEAEQGEGSETQAHAQQSSGGESESSQPQQGMQIEGILGKIPESKIEDVMSGKLPAFQRCFFDGTGEVEFLSGRMDFYFRVGLDGKVERVHPKHSSIGHRKTELCLLDIAKRSRFPKPQGGGAAEFAWGFDIDSPGGVRAPVAWDATRVVDAVHANRASLDACSPGDARYELTAYVSPGGSVLAAGASTDSPEAADKLDCLTDAVKSWKMPDPGSYAAKVTFSL